MGKGSEDRVEKTEGRANYLLSKKLARRAITTSSSIFIKDRTLFYLFAALGKNTQAEASRCSRMAERPVHPKSKEERFSDLSSLLWPQVLRCVRVKG